MRVLGIDPGARRQGFGVVENRSPARARHIAHGILHCVRGAKETYQDYKLRVIAFEVVNTRKLIERYEPDELAIETQPVTGSPHRGGDAQRQVAQAAGNTTIAVAISYDLPVTQIAANTIKKKIGGHGKATKPKVRNGVLQLLAMEEYRKEWTGEGNWEAPDALGVALAHLGHKALVL